MSHDNYSSSEIMQERRRSGVFTHSAGANWPSISNTPVESGQAQDTPAAVNALQGSPRITARYATRSLSSRGSMSDTSKSHKLRSAELLASLDRQGEKRLSNASVVTQVRAPTSIHSTTTSVSTSTRTIIRPHTSGGERLIDKERGIDLAERPSSSMSSRSRTGSKAERSAIKAADADYHAALRTMGGQGPSVRRQNKLEKMFGGPVPMASGAVSRRTGYSTYDDEIPDLPPLPINPKTLVPAVPLRSPRRPATSLKAPPSQHRPSNSIDRSEYNSSITSTANPESDLTNLDSDIFTDSENDASSCTSALSSVAADSNQRKTEPAYIQTSQPSPAITFAEEDEEEDEAITPETESQHTLQFEPEIAYSYPSRANQQLPTAPDASSCYDMLAMRSPTGIEREDFGASRDPFLAMTGVSMHHLPTNVRDVRDFIMTQRPGSPTDSIASDDSYDSALPPPIGLHRDVVGPKFRNRSEQKRAYRKPPPEPIKPEQPQPLSRSHSRAQSRLAVTSTKSAIDLTRRPPNSRSASRNGSVSTFAVSDDRDIPRRARTPFDQPIKSSVGFSWSGFFGRGKKEKEPEMPVMLPPLRKITFDSRGQKQIQDLAKQRTNQVDNADDWDEIEERRMALRSRGHSVSNVRSESSLGMAGHAPAWRVREPGAPRRTAWK